MGIGLFFLQLHSFCGVHDVVVVNKDFLVVVVSNAAHVRHAAVTHFYVVLVKDGVEIVVWWEVFLDSVEEGFCDVGLNIFAVWGVKPCFSFYSFSRVWLRFSCSSEGFR